MTSTTVAPGPPLCPHKEFHARVDVDIGSNPYQAVCTLRCKQCGAPFNFWVNNQLQSALVVNVFPAQQP